MSSEAYERERQNNALLDTLGSKVTELRDITINIYDNARDHDLIDSNVRRPLTLPPRSLSGNLEVD
jgi:blocked-early-in-transport protein 1